MRLLLIHDKGLKGGGTRTQVDRATKALSGCGIGVLTLRLGCPEAGDDSETFPPTFWAHQGLTHRKALLQKIAIFDPGLIHVHGSTGSLSPFLLKALAARWPTIVTLHDVGLFCMNGLRVEGEAAEGPECTRLASSGCWTSGCWRPKAGAMAAVPLLVAKKSQRQEWLSARRILVPSTYMARLAARHGAAPASIAVVPNICPPSHVAPLDPNAACNILFVGRLTREKGADLVLEALARLPASRWTATFVGDGPERPALERRARELGLRGIVFAGWQEGPALDRLRAASTFSVFASRVVESCGLSGLESLAAGRPVVAVARGGVTDWLIEGETGLGVALPDPALLAGTMARLVADRALARRLGEQGRSLVRRRFSAAAHREQLLRIYREVAGHEPVEVR